MSKKPSYEELKNQLDSIQSVSSLDGADVKTFADHVLMSIVKITDSAYGYYGFVDDGESVLTIYTWSGEAMKNCSITDKPAYFPIDDAGVWSEAIRKREPLIINDYSAHHPAKKDFPKGHVQLTNLLVVPFMIKGRITSLAAVANRSADYGQTDVTQLTRYLNSIRAITEAKRAEKKLVKHQYFLQKAQEIGQIGTWELDTIRNELVWTDENYRIFGLPIGNKLTYEIFLSCVHPDDREYVDTKWQAALDGNPYDIEHRLIVGGKTKWVREKAELEFNENGECVKGTGFTQDITGHKQVEAALRESEEKYHLLFELGSDAIFLIEKDTGKILEANTSAANIYGFSREELLRMKNVDLSAEPDQTKQATQDQHTVIPIRYHRKKDGTIFPVEITASHMNWKGRAVHIAAIRDITFRVQAESTLRESEKNLRTTLDATPFPVAVVDLNDDKIYYWSRSALALFGHTAPTASEWYQIAYPDPVYRQEVVARWKPFLEKARESGLPVNTGEYRVTCRDGSERTCELYATFLPDNLIVTFNDITERKQAERGIKKERDFISKVLYWVDSLVTVTDVAGHLVSFNRASEQLSGYRFRELKGKPFWETLLSPDERASVEATIKDVHLTQTPKEFLNHWVTKAGEKRLIQWNNSVLRNEDGSIEYILSTGLDITERQKAETALKESEAKYRELVQNANSIIARIDTSGKIIFFNEYAEKFFGYNAREIIGKNALGTIVPDTDTFGKKLASLIPDIVKNPELYATVENENILRSGRRVWVVWTNKPIYDQKGNIKEILCIGNDITQQKMLEKELQQAQKMEALGTLSGGIAHEVNNILGIIIGNTELAFDDVPEGNPAKDCLEEIRTASLRAKDVVRQIMSFSRKTPTSRKPIQISTIIQESLKLMRSTIPTHIDIRQEILCNKEIILANPTEISQILMNLFSNSIHAMEGKIGWLKIRLETTVLDDRNATSYGDLKPGEYAKLTIKDSGHGIDPKVMPSIFDPYFTTKDVNKGLGMGLAVVYGIVKKHDGAIRVNSKLDKGTTVAVLFPITKETAKIEKGASKDLPRGTERILFIDDEVSLVKLVTQMLERQGYEVVGKTSSTEALKLFQEEPDKFDLVITDMAMPEMPGDHLAQELIKTRPTIPVIICTGHSDRMDEQKAMKSGIAAYTMKPLVKTDLVNIVQRVLDKSKGLAR